MQILAAPATATISGTVTSTQGQPLGRVSLDLLNLDTGRVTTAETDSVGGFHASVEAGLYTVDAGRSGMRLARGPQVVRVAAGQAAVANIAMATAAAMASVAEDQVRVSGDVRTPGSFTFAAGMTVRQALGLAGGMSGNGSADHVYIVRGGKEIKAGMDDVLLPGDGVLVKGGDKAGADGDAAAADHRSADHRSPDDDSGSESESEAEADSDPHPGARSSVQPRPLGRRFVRERGWATGPAPFHSRLSLTSCRLDRRGPKRYNAGHPKRPRRAGASTTWKWRA